MRAIYPIFMAAACLSGAAAASAATFEYKLERLPADRGDCHELARGLGERFQAQTGLTVTRAVCAAIGPAGSNVSITYDAPAPVDVVSTLDFRGGVDTRGVYETEAACRSGLERETQRFEAATGLSAFVAYCFEDKYAGDFPYALRIESFGKPAVRPFVTSTYLFGAIPDTAARSLERTLAAGLQRRGADAAFIRYEDLAGYGRLMMLHYAATPHRLVVPDVGRLATGRQCDAELAVLDDIFEGRADAPLAAYCADDSLLDEWLLNGIFLDAPDVLIGTAAESWSSYDACAAERPQLVQRYRMNYNRKVIAGICGRVGTSTNLWKLTLFEEKPAY